MLGSLPGDSGLHRQRATPEARHARHTMNLVSFFFSALFITISLPMAYCSTMMVVWLLEQDIRLGGSASADYPKSVNETS